MLKNNMNFSSFSKVNEKTNNFALGQTSTLSYEECVKLLSLSSINSESLIALLSARTQGIIDFLLIDNREENEYLQERIAGTNYLIPTSSFYESMKQIEDKKDIACIVYCLSGGRSAQCLRAMKSMGYEKVCNLYEGTYSYKGEFSRG